MKINEELKKYIEKNIFPSYAKNDLGHNLKHIQYVIDRSMQFASSVPDINFDMVYTIAAYHDIGHYIDAKNHEKISSEMLLADKNLKHFFTERQIITMSEAIYDHRASLEYEPRSIYGKIVSSADRNTSVESVLKRTYGYRLKHNPEDSIDHIIEESRKHLMDKFGKKGYATEKMYFEDKEYQQFLEDVAKLTANKDEFKIRFCQTNHLTLWLSLPMELKRYIEKNILPLYPNENNGNGLDRINYVIHRSIRIAENNHLDVNFSILYTAICYHDIGQNSDQKNHETISAEFMMKDKFLKQFFSDEERMLIKEAIEDHRSNLEYEPRNIYGKLLSSASRNSSVEQTLKRSYFYGKKLNPDASDKELFERAYNALLKKFGENGYAKFYFPDEEYETFLNNLRVLLQNKKEFCDKQRELINALKNKNN